MLKNVSNHPLHTTALTLLMVFLPSIALMAQEIAPDYKGASNGNPISASVFCADPTALEYNGRLYVYGTNDHQEFIANGKKGDNSWAQAHGTKAMESHGHHQSHGVRQPTEPMNSSSTSAIAATASEY